MTRWTVGVGGTGHWHVAAGDEGVSSQPVGARALCLVVHSHTLCVGATARGMGAGIRALVVEARQMVGTSSIGSASGAAGQSLAHFARTTVIVTATDRLAGAIVATLVVQAARVVGAQRPTHFREAGESVGALAILRTGQGGCANTAHIGRRTGHHSRDTRAGGAVIGHGARGIRATRIVLAGIVAPVVPARLARAAVFIRMASKDALIAQANVAQEAVVVHAACHCIGA